jgi:FixJ family two-component response regulator
MKQQHRDYGMTPTLTADRLKAHQELKPRVFIVNGDESVRTWVEAIVISSGLHALSFRTAAEFMGRFEEETVACAILDVVLQDASAFELQDYLARVGVSVIFLSRERCIPSCVRAMKAGAADFLTMPCDATQLARSLRHAIRQASLLLEQLIQVGELRSRYQQLTSREREIFALVSTGLRNKQIAQRLDISEITVQIHRGRVMKKMSAHSFASLVRMADCVVAEMPGASTAAGCLVWDRKELQHRPASHIG